MVKIIALIHVGIGVHAAIRLAQELLTMRVMGVAESFVNLIEQSISVIVNPLIALGFWRAWRSARWLAIGWYLLLSVIGVIVSEWYWRVPLHGRFPEASRFAWWPDYFADRVMPLFLLILMFVPRVKRTFARGKAAPQGGLEAAASEQTARSPSRRWSGLSVIVLLFLMIVLSALAVATADWIERSVSGWNQP